MFRLLDELTYPVELRWLQAHGLTGLTPWHFITEDGARGLRAEFRREATAPHHQIRDFLPFASRQDCDDVAGFVVVDGVATSQVIEVHLTWRGSVEAAGFPSLVVYDSLWAWLKSAIDHTRDWCNEEELSSLTECADDRQPN